MPREAGGSARSRYYPAQETSVTVSCGVRGEERQMVTLGPLLRLQAKPAKGGRLGISSKALCHSVRKSQRRRMVRHRMGPVTTSGIFDAFPGDTGRQAHLEGRVAAALMAQAPNLLAQPPSIERSMSGVQSAQRLTRPMAATILVVCSSPP